MASFADQPSKPDQSTTPMMDVNGVPATSYDSSSAPHKNENITTSTSDTIYIGNLPLQYASEAVIEKLVQPYGRVQRVSVQQRYKEGALLQGQKHKQQQRSIAFAFGQMQSPEQATAAIRGLDGRKLAGQRLVVRAAHQSSSTTSMAAVAAASIGTSSSATVQQQKRQVESRIQAIQQKLKRQQQQQVATLRSTTTAAQKR
jgi:RNA recognition motif-containing protein